MSNENVLSANVLRTVRWGIVLSMAAILLGFVLGGAFGAFEHPIQDWLRSQGEAVLTTVYNGDQAALDKTLDRSWSYFLRAHMHGGGIGSAVLGLSLLLALLPAADKLRTGLSTAMGLGTLGYASFWLLAGMRAPVLGSTSAAKESLKWLAIPSAGLLLVGVALTLGLTVWTLWRRQKTV